MKNMKKKLENMNIKILNIQPVRTRGMIVYDSMLGTMEISGVADLEQKELMTLSWSLVCVESHKRQ